MWFLLGTMFGVWTFMEGPSGEKLFPDFYRRHISGQWLKVFLGGQTYIRQLILSYQRFLRNRHCYSNTTDRNFGSFPWFGVSANIGFQTAVFTVHFHLDSSWFPSHAPPRILIQINHADLFNPSWPRFGLFAEFHGLENTENRIVKQKLPYFIAGIKEGFDQSPSAPS